MGEGFTFDSMTSQERPALLPEDSQFGSTGGPEVRTVQAPSSSSVTVSENDRLDTLTTSSEHLVTLAEIFSEIENFYFPSEGNGTTLFRRSPLPLWYPRRPLQDITAILDATQVPCEESPTDNKKKRKKAQKVNACRQIHDAAGEPFREQKPPRTPLKATSFVRTGPTRSALLRKGFR